MGRFRGLESLGVAPGLAGLDHHTDQAVVSLLHEEHKAPVRLEGCELLFVSGGRLDQHTLKMRLTVSSSS